MPVTKVGLIVPEGQRIEDRLSEFEAEVRDKYDFEICYFHDDPERLMDRRVWVEAYYLHENAEDGPLLEFLSDSL